VRYRFEFRTLKKLTALPEGSFYTEPAGVPHFVATPDGEIVLLWICSQVVEGQHRNAEFLLQTGALCGVVQLPLLVVEGN